MRPHLLFTLCIAMTSSTLGVSACSGDEPSSADDAPRAEPEAGGDVVTPNRTGSETPETSSPDGSTFPSADGGDGDGASNHLVDGGDAASVPTTPREACIAYVKTVCARRKQCGVNDTFGNCEARAGLCPDVLFAMGSTRTFSQVVACTQLRATQSCEEVRVGFEPPCAITPGTRKADAPCHFDAQCASLSCAFGNAGTCSTCRPLQSEAPGESCPGQTTCGPNMRCMADGGCAAITVPTTLASGASCDADAGVGVGAQTCPREVPCASTTAGVSTGTCSSLPSSGACLYALGATSQSLCAAGTFCVRADPTLPQGECLPPATKDELCGSGYGGRACVDGYFCTSATGGSCQPKHVVNEPCESSSQCEPSLFCQRDSFQSGQCRPRLAVGDGCGPVDGGVFVRDCEGDARCTNVTTDGGVSGYCCVRRAGLGEACSAPFEPCASLLTCKAGVCGLVDCPTDAGSKG